MKRPWWIKEDSTAQLDVPVYTDETGWATLDPEVFPKFDLENDRVEYRLKPYPEGLSTPYTARPIVLSESMGDAVEIYLPQYKLSKARLAGSPALVNLMVDMIALREPPLISGPFTHGTKDSQATRSASGQMRTREGQYKAARRSGDPLAFARALRDIFQREQILKLGRRVERLAEFRLLKRMAIEMAFEVAYSLPRPRQVKPEDAIEWGKKEFMRRTGAKPDIFGD